VVRFSNTGSNSDLNSSSDHEHAAQSGGRYAGRFNQGAEIAPLAEPARNAHAASEPCKPVLGDLSAFSRFGRLRRLPGESLWCRLRFIGPDSASPGR
jgi:hypothetical protein